MSLPSQPRAVVTGAGSGLGRALCLELARRQARLIVSDRDLPSAQETARLAQQLGAQARAVSCDVTRPEALEALASAAEQAFGGVDLVVNNAGIAVAGPVGEVSLEAWQRVLEVNLWGVIHGCHTFIPRLKRQGSGHVLNIASTAGLVYAPKMGPYNASKAAVVALSETLAGELSEEGIGVTVACPTFFSTRIAESGEFSDERLRAVAQRLMDRAALSAEDVARACLHACERDRLYALPMTDGRWLWRLRRLWPAAFVRLLPRLQQLQGSNSGQSKRKAS